MSGILVGVVDSGVTAGFSGLIASRRFDAGDGAQAVDDRIGHGTAIAHLLREHGGGPGLLVAQVFAQTQRCSPERVTAALEWLVERGAALINLSVGLREASACLRGACERAEAAGVMLVASAPARGAPVYPAAYAQCIAVSGDARCADDEISWLGSANADFGAHPFLVPGDSRSGGASYAAARVSGRIVRLLADGTPAKAIAAALQTQCRYHGPERRRA
jgi:Subtilase family